MAEFLVKVADERGNVLEQVESAASEKEVRERFAQQGYLVYWVRGRGLVPGLFSRRRSTIRRDQFVIFNQQFLALIKAGLPILKSLELLAKRQRNAYFKSMLENVQQRVKSGELLSDAFAAQGSISGIYTTTLLAGERSGNLEEVLGRYIAFQRVTLAFRKKLLSSLIYPAVLVTALTAMLTFLMAYVVPQFADLYNSLNAKLPEITVFMLSIGTAIRQYYWVILIVLIAAILSISMWIRSEAGSRGIDAFRYRLPLFGPIWMKYQIAMFSRTMATLLSGGLPLVPSLETASRSIDSHRVSAAVEHAGQRVREGRSLSYSMEETGFFPELAIEMVEVGESTGALPSMLNSIAEFFEDDVQVALSAALQLVEPALLIIMGCTVAVVLISLYLPIFSLGAQLAR